MFYFGTTLIIVTKFTQILCCQIMNDFNFNFINAHDHESCKTIVRQNITTACALQ